MAKYKVACRPVDFVFYRDDCNFKTIVFQGTTDECEEYVKEFDTYTSSDGEEYELEIWSLS